MITKKVVLITKFEDKNVTIDISMKNYLIGMILPKNKFDNLSDLISGKRGKMMTVQVIHFIIAVLDSNIACITHELRMLCGH